MRILVVQESDWLERGPHQSHHLMERMVQRGHEVHVIDFPIGWMKELHKGFVAHKQIRKGVYKVVPPGVTVIRPQIIRLPILSYLSTLVTHRLAIEREIINYRPDVIVGFGLLNARMAIRQGNKRGIPFVYYIIDELHRLVPEELFQPIAKSIESGNNGRANAIIAINEGLMDYCIEMGANPSKSFLIRAGVDFERFSKADGSIIRKKYGFNEDDTVLFFMGWLYDFSGLDEVALELARSEKNNLKMLVLGKGELWDRLHEIKKKFELGDRLIIEDWKPYDDVPKYLAAADICILPAKRSKVMENIVPIKMYEYLAAGKVVFATDLSGIHKEFKDGNGIVYLKEPKEAVSNAMDLILSGTMVSVGRKGQDFVRSNDWALMVEYFNKTLKEVSNV